MPPTPDDDRSFLERARERLYDPQPIETGRFAGQAPGTRHLPHAWGDEPSVTGRIGARHVRLAGIFFMGAVLFFLVALGVAAFSFFAGGNTVSTDKIDIALQGPTTIAGGDTMPLSIAVTNTNPVAIQDATIEIDFPDGTRSADNVLQAYPRYTENLGTIGSGETVLRSVKAVLFGAAGSSLVLPVQVSYGTPGSNAVFVKKTTYTVSVSSTPLSVSVDTLAETVSGKPLTVSLTVRSNAAIPIDNVVLSAVLPFGFAYASSSLPMADSSFLLGTLAPGASKSVTITGILSGQDKEQRVFHFTVGTAHGPGDTALAVSYLSQDATVSIAAPFLATSLSLNGNPFTNATLLPGMTQNVTVSYANTLATNVTNATVSVQITGNAVDYGSIRTTTGFYRSADHTIVFSPDTDASLSSLAPGATGIGTFSFSTIAGGQISPAVSFVVSVAGTRIGQTNVPETVSNTATYTAKVQSALAFAAAALHASGPLANSGPIPPQTNKTTSYTVSWTVQNGGNAVAGGTVTAVLPSYVTYTGATAGAGSFAYDDASRTVTWSVGDLAQNGRAAGSFQVALTPSTSQKGSAPALTGPASFTGHDRFAGVDITAAADPVTTETPGDPGYVPTDASVQ